MIRKDTLYSLLVTTVVVAALHILKSDIRLSQSVLNALFISGVLGLVWINILLFAIPLLKGLACLKERKATRESQEQIDHEDEKELEKLLQGESAAQGEMPNWARIGVAICIGLIVGSLLGVICNRIITYVLPR